MAQAEEAQAAATERTVKAKKQVEEIDPFDEEKVQAELKAIRARNELQAQYNMALLNDTDKQIQKVEDKYKQEYEKKVGPIRTPEIPDGSKPKTVEQQSREPEETAPVELEAMSTSNCFLIVKVESVKSTEATFCFGRTVNKVLSNPSWKLEDKIVKSLGLISELGRPPSQTSVTLVIPVKVRLC